MDALADLVSRLSRLFSTTGPILHVEWPSARKAVYALHQPGQPSTPVQEVDSAAQPRVPMADDAADTLLNLGSLAQLDEDRLAAWLQELRRVAGRNVWVSIAPTHDRPQVWWESRFFAAGFRKHQLTMLARPYGAPEDPTQPLVLLFEKVPDAALSLYPLSLLKEQRDLHMDMLRESGVRSEAHLARYQLAAQYANDGGVILDGACGLGYGSAMLARQFPNARVIGVDISEYAVRYARENFASVLPNLEFHVADACALTMIEPGSLDLVVSFETIEHVREPGRFVAGVVERMKPGAVFIGSVPNLWLDETGRDPNPWHFHVFDLPKFFQLLNGPLNVSTVYRQNAGGWLRNPECGPVLRPVQLPVTDQLEEAEWWLLVAQKSPAAAFGANRPRIWLIDGDTRGHFYARLRGMLDAEWITRRDQIPDALDLAIVSDEWWWKNALAVQDLKRRGVPTLHVMDGVVDWKNTWENPRSLDEDSGLPLFQPVLSDKIACLGASQARLIASWGQAAKAEVIGVPRFDRYFGLKKRTRNPGQPARVLIMTANKPYFNDRQHQEIRTGLLALKAFFAGTADVGVPVEPVWRLTGGLETEIGVESSVSELTGRELAEVLCSVDAVVCSSSTAMLEAMLIGLPTALLDFSNVPHYIQPAWQIAAPDQIGPVISELLDAPAAKLLFQETVLHDALECASPATPRLARLAADMIAISRTARANGKPPVFPAGMAPATTCANAYPENRFSLEKLYPGHSVFRINDLAVLQAELGHRRNGGATPPEAGSLSPGIVAMGQSEKRRNGAALKPAPLEELARFVGDDWKHQSYYDEAEQGMDKQWNEHVWPLIQQADFNCVLDLAAGHGRNSERLRQFAKKLYVVDINQENIDFCRRRFEGDDRFTFIRTDGTSLAPIPDASVSLAYCFDAMVHFDSDIVRAYLREFRRVLRPGGLGFCHHSNYVGNPGGDVHDNKGWRNYMSQSLFAHYCAKEGLRVLTAKLVDWEAPGSDCVTLFARP